MKRGKRDIVILVVFTIIIIIPLISAGIFSDIWNKITGRASSQLTNVSVSISGVNPAKIVAISYLGAINPLENLSRSISINVTVYDADGASDIDDSSVVAIFNFTGEGTRQNSSCTEVPGESTTYTENFTCTIIMWYWDINGSWGINITANDLGNQTPYSNFSNFTYNLLKALVISPQALTWPSVSSGATNQTSDNDPTYVNNTGNYNGTIQLTAIDLSGETTKSERIWAGNFSTDIDTGGSCSGDTCVECDGTHLQNETAVTIVGTVANRGNRTINEEGDNGVGQEELYHCIREVPPGLSSQTYSTNNSGSWTILYP